MEQPNRTHGLTQKAGKHSTVHYTLAKKCRRPNFDPETYLREVLTRLLRATNHNVHLLTPRAMARELPSKITNAA